MSSSLLDIAGLAQSYADKSPQQILEVALKGVDNIVLSFSGEHAVLLDMALKIKPSLRVFTIDTGRLHPETHRFLEEVRTHYGIEIDTLYPNYQNLERYTKEKGLFDFYKNGHTECCSIRKTEPLRRILGEVDAWITGQRRDQSPGTRSHVAVFEEDKTFSSPEHPLLKVNPLANFTSQELWNYIRMLELPYNKLHDRGFISIGCEPCTRAVLPNQHEREGRWWWEESAQKECGLHAGNLITRA